jgi:hypothetical protein
MVNKTALNPTRRLAVLIEWDDHDEPHTIFSGSPGEMPMRFYNPNSQFVANYTMENIMEEGPPVDPRNGTDLELLD